jgi:hypothetical protein
MWDDGEGEQGALLAQQRLDRKGMVVKLDKGFAEGVYCVYIEFYRLASQVAFTAARRKALENGSWLRGQLSRGSGLPIGELEDAALAGGRGRKFDLEATYLSFPVTTEDGRFHDGAMRKEFQVALARVGQAWDQAEARQATQRRVRRQGEFGKQLSGLLEGAAYAHLDQPTKEQLLNDVTALAVRSKEREL